MKGNNLQRIVGGGLAALLAGAVIVSGAEAAAEDPATARDDTWISVSGTVVSTTPHSFRLDHGDGIITVEMDDFDLDADGRALMANDEVVVYGRVDHDLFEKKTIEASSVYVDNLNTHFYASAADEEDFDVWTVAVPVHVGRMEVTGTVTSTIGREFTIDTGASRVQVDTMDLYFNPMDEDGYLQIEVGDRVKVGGDIDTSFFDETELSADWIIELED